MTPSAWDDLEGWRKAEMAAFLIVEGEVQRYEQYEREKRRAQGD